MMLPINNLITMNIPFPTTKPGSSLFYARWLRQSLFIVPLAIIGVTILRHSAKPVLALDAASSSWQNV